MSRSRRRRGERGATLLELAIVLPFLSLMAFGTAEMGMAWVANNRTEGASSNAARIAASSGSLLEADRSVLLSLKSSLPADLLANLDRVIIFNASSASGVIPSGCIKPIGSTNQAGVTASCNTFSGDTVRATTTFTATTSLPVNWAPTSRNDDLSDPPDYIGVYVRTRYDAVTGTALFGDRYITRTSIYRIQPDING